MNQGISDSSKTDISQAAGTSGTSSELYRPIKSYTPEEKSGVLGRHTVAPQKLSMSELAGMGALGGLVGATLGGVAKSTTDCSWTTIAATSVIGATIFVSGTVVSNKPLTPLEHAEAELIQTQEDKKCLIKRDIDNPLRTYDASELYTIKRLSERYSVSWQLFKILWEVLNSSHWKSDNQGIQNAMAAICSRLKELNVSQWKIDHIVQQMKDFDSVEEAKKLLDFQALIKLDYIPKTARHEIAQLMFAYSRLLLSTDKNPHGAGLCNLYQEVCLEMYESFKVLIAVDESRLIDDIRILRAITEEDKFSLDISQCTGNQY